MAKKAMLENAMASFGVQHRAVCQEGDFNGKWRADLGQARDDAQAHQDAHHDHEIRIVTQQEMSMKFTA